jgi:hypothetical protein
MRLVRKAVSMLGLTAVVLAAGAAPAQAVTITAIATPLGGVFDYDYSITFDPLEDEIILIDVFGPVGDLTLTNETAPAGFVTIYDPGTGFISFLPGIGSTFPLAGTLPGFGFESALGPAPTTFDALTIFVATLSGDTIAPLVPQQGSIPVPEPASVALWSVLLAAAGSRRVLRARRTAGRSVSGGGHTSFSSSRQ